MVVCLILHKILQDCLSVFFLKAEYSLISYVAPNYQYNGCNRQEYGCSYTCLMDTIPLDFSLTGAASRIRINTPMRPSCSIKALCGRAIGAESAKSTVFSTVSVYSALCTPVFFRKSDILIVTSVAGAPRVTSVTEAVQWTAETPCICSVVTFITST